MDEDRTLSAINNYEANLKKQQAEQLRRNIIAASQRNPDQYAEAVQLSRMNNVPPAIIASDIDTYRNNSKLDDATARKIVTQYKTFDEWLQNPDNAALAHDDIGALTTVFDGVENVGRSIGSGFALGFNGIWGSLATQSATASKYVGQPFDRGLKYIGADPNSDADPFDDLSNFFQKYAVTNRKMSERIIQPAMKDAGTIERGVYSGIQSIASNLPGMIASVITKNPGVGLVSAGVTTGGQSASQALEKGLPVDTALKYGITDAGIEVATEFLPITKFISDLKVGSSFGKTIANQMIAEVPGELAATTGQNFTNWIYLNPDKTFSDYAKELPEDLAQTFIATVSSVGLQTGTLKLVDYAISDKEKVSIEKAKIANLKTDIQGAKLNTRDPEKMREVLKAANPDNKTATIDAGVLSHFYQSGLDPEEFFNLVPDARTQFENAELSGSDINIPYDEFVYAIANAPTPNSYDFMTDFIKVDPDIDPNMHEWDMKDPDQVNALIRDILDQTREQFDARYEQVQQLPLAEEIERRFRDTLMNQDIMGEKVRNAQTAADEAKVLMEYVSTRLSKGGKAAEDTFMQRLSKDKFFLTGYKPPMPKIIGTGSSFYDRLRAKYKAQQRNINKPRKKDIFGFSKPKRDKATPTPLINALIKRGGVKRGSKIAAELEHIGITTKSHPRLYAHGKLQDIDNIPIDDLEGDIGTSGIFSRDADLNGYVDRSELLDKIRDESHGDYIRTDEQAAKEQQDEYDAQILDILDQEGVDITTATADDIDAALKAYQDRYNNEDGQQYFQSNDFQERVIAAQDLRDAAKEQKYKVKIDGNGYVTVYHGTSQKNAEKIKADGRFNESSFFSFRKSDVEYYANEKNKNGEVFEIKVDPRDIEYSTGSGEVFAPDILVKSDNGYYVSIKRPEQTQYFQAADKTNTPEFKKWFGDSKVVDADGNPLVVYHGSRTNIEQFDVRQGRDEGFYGKGIYFTPDSVNASGYAETAITGFTAGPNIIPAYISLQKPFVVNWSENEVSAKDFVARLNEIGAEALTEELKTQGYDGVMVYAENIDRINKLDEVVAFEPEQIKSVFNRGTFDPNDSRILYQDNHAVTKFLNNGQTVIELFQKANESSLMHEMGHLFLDLDAQIANHPEAPQAFKDEFNATLAWLGIEKYSDAQVKHHEQFARGFEAYLYTGETPNAELKSVFQRMVIWFTRIYKNIRQLGVKINPEMKAVFDRLLATDEAIEAQKTDKLFNVDKATMEMLNPKQQEEYLKRKEQALQAAKEKLFRKAYRQKLREKTEWWKEESDKVRSEVEADLMKQPVYQAIIKLQDGQEKLNQDMVIKSIDRGNTINPIGKFEIKYLPRGIISKEGTLDPGVIADIYGFKSAEQMYYAMKSADPYTKAVQKQTEERMIARHGDMLNDGTIENEALAMVMAEDTKAAQVELKALTEKTGILYPSDGDFEKAARLALSKLKVDQAIAPDKYYRAAMKSAREYGAALAKKNYEAAAESKRKEIINKHLYAQSKKAREETTKALDHFKKLDKKPPKGNAKAVKIDPDYHEKIWDLLDKYDFNPKISQKKELKLQLAALNQWIQAKEKDEDAVLIMPPELTAADGKTHYRDLTMNEFRAVRDLIDNLETQGRRKRKYIVEGKEKDLAEVTREMVDTAEKFTNPLEHPLTEDRRWLAKMGSFVGGIDAINTKIQQIMVKLDGGDNYGVWTRSVYEPMQRAVINQAIRMRQEGDNLRALMEKYYADDKKSFKDFIAERGGFTITREELISIAMHFTATEDNRAKLLDFYEKKHGWDEEFIRDVLTQMRSKDWQFVMGVRDLYESFWAETSAIEKRRFGYAPEKLEGLPTETFTTVDGTDIDVRGGYARIKYDSRHSFKTMANDLKDAYKELAIGSGSIAATKRGSMKERKASSGQAIRLDLDVIGEHIAEQVGIITMSEAVENTAKVLRQDNVQEVMHNNLGKEYKMMVDLWLQDVAAGEGTAAQVNGAILRKIRTNYTIGKLALKPLTALVQMSGIVQTMADPDLGVKYTLHGLKDFLSQDPRTTSEQIRAKSAYMQERKFTLNRDVADALNEYTNKGKTIQDKAAALMLLPMQKVQAMVDMVTWKAAYIKALDDRMDDADAIRYADLSVSRLQGSGLSTDQAAIERGTLGNSVRKQEAVKTGTVLFSYFNAKYNIAKNAKIKYDNKQISAVDLAASITLSFLVEGLVSAFLMGQIDWDKDEDGETTLGEATIGLGQMALYNAASTIPYGRTVASTIQGFTPHDAFTAQLVALGKFIGTAAGDSYDLLTDTKDLEDINWESRAKTTIDAIGVFFAIPSSEAKVLIRAVNKEDPELMDYLVYQK